VNRAFLSTDAAQRHVQLIALELTFVGSENLDVSLPNPARGKCRAAFLMRQIPDATRPEYLAHCS
jgi:hypothetical protein